MENENKNLEKIKIGTQSLTLPTIAIVAMLGAVLLPSVVYSINLNEPTPSELLIAICIGVFSSVLSLWILNITSIINFKEKWLSKSIWTTVIVSILGSSVGVYKESFSERTYKLEGRWELSIWNNNGEQLVLDKDLILLYSKNSEVYWGYSEYSHIIDEESKIDNITWVNIKYIDIDNSLIELELLNKESRYILRFNDIDVSKNKKIINAKNGHQDVKGTHFFRITRPR